MTKLKFQTKLFFGLFFYSIMITALVVVQFVFEKYLAKESMMEWTGRNVNAGFNNTGFSDYWMGAIFWMIMVLMATYMLTKEVIEEDSKKSDAKCQSANVVIGN